MDLTTLFYNLREEVSCSVCSDLFTDPKHLSCLHSFCLKCLNRWYETCGGGQTIKCPKCQTLSRVPASGDLKDLPTSFYLNGLIDVLAIRECKKTHVTCGNCDKKSSEASYCFQCCIFYCEQGLVPTHLPKNWKHWSQYDARQKETSRIGSERVPRQGLRGCNKATSILFKTRTPERRAQILLQRMRNSSVSNLLRFGSRSSCFEINRGRSRKPKTRNKYCFSKKREGLNAKLNVLAQLDEDRAKVIQQSEIAKRDVQRFADGLIKTIQVKMQNLIATLENQTKRSLESLKAKGSEIQHQLNVTESSLEEADNLLKRSTTAEVVQLKNHFRQSLIEWIRPTHC